MRRLTIPTSAAETLKAPEFVWPAVEYEAIIEKVESKAVPTTQSNEPFAGYVSTKGKVLGIRLGNIRPMEELPEGTTIGNRKFFVDVAVENGDFDIFSSYEELTEAGAWQLTSAQRTLTNLAIALNAADVTNGHASFDENFLDALESGELNGMQVRFVLYHNRGKKRDDGTTPIYANLETFKKAS